MHQHPKYHAATDATTLAFLRERSFGTLFISAPAGPLAMQSPFVMSNDGTRLEGHIFRGNPMVEALAKPLPAIMVVNGPDGYISPDWYGPGSYVSTWNYVSVQVKGVLSLGTPDELHDMLERQTAAYESRLSPKKPWTMDKMAEGAAERLKRAILPFSMRVEVIEPTWKLGQEKPAEAVYGASDNLPSSFGSELNVLSALMRRGGPGDTDL